jgi:hypothetical protein
VTSLYQICNGMSHAVAISYTLAGTWDMSHPDVSSRRLAMPTQLACILWGRFGSRAKVEQANPRTG